LESHQYPSHSRQTPHLPPHGSFGFALGNEQEQNTLAAAGIFLVELFPLNYSHLANPQTGEGYTNTELKAGDRVSVIGAKAYPLFRSELGLRYFGPRYWGFDFDYVPIEEVLGQKR